MVLTDLAIGPFSRNTFYPGRRSLRALEPSTAVAPIPRRLGALRASSLLAEADILCQMTPDIEQIFRIGPHPLAPSPSPMY